MASTSAGGYARLLDTGRRPPSAWLRRRTRAVHQRGTKPGLNRIQRIGRLGRDPETRTTTGKRSVAPFWLAVDRGWKTDSGQAKEATDGFSVDAWSRRGEVCQKNL